MIRRTNNLSITTCALCRNSNDLRDSHIIPRFVFDWAKRTSATGYLRLGLAPNQRVQDGFIERLLCGACEDRLNKFETPTAKQIFFPLHEKNTRELKYGAWFEKFCASIAWRTLILYRGVGLDELSPETLKNVDDALETWRMFLIDEIAAPSPFDLFAIPLDAIQSTNGRGVPPNFNQYLLRKIDPGVLNHQGFPLVYAKLCRLLVIGSLSWDDPKAMRKARVNHGQGNIGKAIAIPEFIGTYLAERAKHAHELQSQISDRQMDRISQTMDKDFERTVNSESFAALTRDVNMFGDAAFAKKRR